MKEPKKRKVEKNAFDATLAYNWLAAHPLERGQYVGKWIAVTPDGIAASSKSIKVLVLRQVV